jgi:hypothetical protein
MSLPWPLPDPFAIAPPPTHQQVLEKEVSVKKKPEKKRT